MQQIQPKFEIGVKLSLQNKIYKVSDYVYYTQVNRWYYWLRETRKRPDGKWVYAFDSRQVMVDKLDNEERVIVVAE